MIEVAVLFMMQAETAFLAKDFFRAASFYAKVSIVWHFFF